MKIILALFFSILNTRSTPTSQFFVGNPYEGCCGLQPISITVGDAKLFIPNVFTPNGDGVNDLFLPFASKEVAKVSDFVITNLSADSVFFQVANFQLSEGSFGWDGRIETGKYHQGPFKYQMTIYSKTGESLMLEGSACSVLCDSAAFILKENTNCFYPIQADNLGGVDAFHPSFENKRCFKN